jgi:hypothetical protein
MGGGQRRTVVVKIEAYHDGEMWCARGLGVDVFTQAETLDELMASIREAVALHFEGEAEVPDVLVLSELKAPRAKAATG